MPGFVAPKLQTNSSFRLSSRGLSTPTLTKGSRQSSTRLVLAPIKLKRDVAAGTPKEDPLGALDGEKKEEVRTQDEKKVPVAIPLDVPDAVAVTTTTSEDVSAQRAKSDDSDDGANSSTEDDERESSSKARAGSKESIRSAVSFRKDHVVFTSDELKEDPPDPSPKAVKRVKSLMKKQKYASDKVTDEWSMDVNLEQYPDSHLMGPAWDLPPEPSEDEPGPPPPEDEIEVLVPSPTSAELGALGEDADEEERFASEERAEERARKTKLEKRQSARPVQWATDDDIVKVTVAKTQYYESKNQKRVKAVKAKFFACLGRREEEMY